MKISRKLIKGVNDLETLFPNLTKEWHLSLNDGLKPSDFSPGSNKVVWWKCNKGHEWQSSIHNRTRGTKCPICAGKVILTGFNDLGTNYPELLKEWAFDLNADDPFKISCHSNMDYYWRCEKGHVWKDNINHRTYRNSKCPYCQNKRVLKGYNDLETLYPMLAKEWDYEKNRDLKPDQVTRGSTKKVWWKCPNCKKSYLASIYHRVCGTGCSTCNKMLQTSVPEQAILFYIKKVFPETLSRRKDLLNNSLELDIFIPSKMVAIEYDGIAWHKTLKSNEREIKKYQLCRQKGIFLYRVKEENNNLQNADMTIVVPRFSYDNVESLTKAIKTIIKNIDNKITIDIDIKRDLFDILKFRIVKYKDSLAYNYPEIASEWHPTLNKELKPENVLPGTSLKVWWKCKNGHEWQSSVVNRAKGHGCDICAREQRKVEQRKTLLETRESLFNCKCVIDWDYSKNKHNPDYYTKGSGAEVWWKCHKCGHEWKTAICNRTRDYKNGCPACSNRIVIKGKNDLETLNPDFLSEWDYEKNGDLKPSDVSQWTHKKVWWKCKKCGYSYQASPSNRNLGKGCGCCAGRVVVPGINDLATTRPDLAIDWHPTKNGLLTPKDVTKGRRDMVWWKCHVCGHEWQDTLNHRSRGRGCSNCKKAKRNT